MKIAIVGNGKIGSALHALIRDAYEVSIFDIGMPYNAGDFDAVVNAAPHTVNKELAHTCSEAGTAYLDFSEDVASTDYIKGLKGTFIPQCGLAPGAVNIIASSMIRSLERPTSCEIRVGALPRYVNNDLKYFRMWSTEGLVNECVKKGRARASGKIVETEPLGDTETLVLDGVEYEAFNTSGGIGTMCETFDIPHLNYKTLRYPGHRDAMRSILETRTQEEAVAFLNEKLPTTDQDVIVIHISVIGDGKQKSYTKKIYGHNGLSAIQLATASGLAGVLELFIRGSIAPSESTGFLRQEDIALEDFLSTKHGSLYTPE